MQVDYVLSMQGTLTLPQVDIVIIGYDDDNARCHVPSKARALFKAGYTTGYLYNTKEGEKALVCRIGVTQEDPRVKFYV